MNVLSRRINIVDAQVRNVGEILRREWLLTNGLGGYASGTISGRVSRRYHGLLVAALPAPLGRMVMLNHLSEYLRLPDGRRLLLGGDEPKQAMEDSRQVHYITEFRLEHGLPVWTYEAEGYIIEKSIVLIHRQNTMHVTYRLLNGPDFPQLELQPAVHFRPHENDVGEPTAHSYSFLIHGDQYEVSTPLYPYSLRMCVYDKSAHFTYDGDCLAEIFYKAEADRGYPSLGGLWSPGIFVCQFRPNQRTTTLMASTEQWTSILALDPNTARETELARRRNLVAAALPNVRTDVGAEIVLAADQFIIRPAGRVEDAARAEAAGDEARTIIAGYHWFTDWGRDTMISLEGLTFTTGRHA